MFRIIRRHLNPASLIAMVALFAALGGVSYAAATIHGKDIKNGTITAKKLKNGSVTTAKVKNGAVTAAKVRNGSLTGAKVKPDSLTGGQIDESTLGPVPNAVSAQTATSAQTAVNAETADSATNAETATTVGANGVGTAALQNGSVRASKLASTTFRTQATAIAAGATALGTTSCQAGERLLSGGVHWSGSMTPAAAAVLHVVHSYPSGNSWLVRGFNGTGTERTMTVFAICLNG